MTTIKGKPGKPIASQRAGGKAIKRVTRPSAVARVVAEKADRAAKRRGYDRICGVETCQSKFTSSEPPESGPRACPHCQATLSEDELTILLAIKPGTGTRPPNDTSRRGEEPCLDYRPLNVGDKTPHGLIALCPCGRAGAMRQPGFWPQAQFFVHTVKRVAGVAEMRVIGRDKFVDDGISGRPRPDHFHIVVDGKIVERGGEMGQGSRVRGTLNKPGGRVRTKERTPAGTAPNASVKRKTGQSKSDTRKASEGASKAREKSDNSNHDKQFRCVNHKVCGSKTRKHAKGLCYDCYRAARKTAK